MLFGCIHIPNFLLQAAIRHEDHQLTLQPVAILDGPDSMLRVVAANHVAEKYGIEIGMGLQQAELCPGIILRKRIPACEAAAHAALLDCGYSVSPRVESTAPGIVIADLSGTEELLGSPEKIGCSLAVRARQCGLGINVGIAANPDTAQYAALGIKGISVIPSGEEGRQLAGLPIRVLNVPAEILEVLDGWGIHTFGALAALPSLPLIERLGQAGLALQRITRGETQRELVPAELPLSFEEDIELEETVDLLESLSFALNRLLEQVVMRLQY